jgi:hypothetical protein
MLVPTAVVDVEVILKHLQELASPSLNTSDIVRVKVLVTFFRPNGMTV